MTGPLNRQTYAWMPFLLIGITILSLGIGAIGLHYLETSLIAATGENLAVAAVDIAGQLDMLLTERYGDMQMLAWHPVLRGRDVAPMTAYLQAVQETSPVYVWLGVMDATGIVTAATDQATVGADRSRSAWFQAAREGGGVYAGEMEVSEEAGGDRVVSFAAPIRGPQGEFLGMVAALVGLPAMEDIFAHTAVALQAQRGTASRIEYQFLDHTGTVIADSLLREEGRVNLKQLGAPSALRFDKAPSGFVEELHQRRAVPVITGYAQTKGVLSWGVLVRMDRDDILVPIRMVLWRIGGAGIVIWLPMFVVLLWSSGRLKHAWTVANDYADWLGSTLAGVGDGVIATDHKGGVVFMNPLAEHMTGWSQAEAKGRLLTRVFAAVSEDTKRPIENPVFTVRRAGERVELPQPLVLITQDGFELPIAGSMAPMRGQRGNARGIVVAFYDHSAHRRMERRQAAQVAVSLALAESLTLDQAAPRLLREICETVGWDLGSIWMVDGEGRALRCEAPWYGLSVKAEEFVALSRSTTFSPGVGLPGRVWEHGKPAWITDVTKEPNFPRAPAARQAGLHAAFAFPITGEGRVLGVIEFFSRQVRPLDTELLNMMADVGIKIGQFVRRRRAEAAALASEERFRLAIEYATDALFYVDATGIIQWVSTRASALTERSADKLVGCSLMEAFAHQPLAKAQLVSIGLGRAIPPLMEFEIFLQDRTAHWLEVACSQVKADEQTFGWLLVARDITERKRMEEHLRQAEKRISLGTLLDGVAHELNNPLFMISGNVQLAREDMKHGRYEGVDGELAAIQEAVGRAAEIVQRILAVSRSNSGRREACQVGQRLQQALDVAANDLAIHQIQVRATIAADLPLVQADPNELTQVFLSVITNAREAMASSHGRGTLTVSASLTASEEAGHGEEALRGRGDGGDWIDVRIQDDGPGIAPELQARIFDPFFAAKPAGQATGLGLSIAHRIVSSLGGTLTVESLVGQGTTFIVRLPAVEGTALAPVSPTALTADPSPQMPCQTGDRQDDIPLRLQRWAALRQEGQRRLFGQQEGGTGA